MSKQSYNQSALCFGTGDNDDEAFVLVVGGSGGTGNEAALLTNRPHQARGNRHGQWRWQQLSPMQEKRDWRPGLLLLGGERVLVCGGNDGDGGGGTGVGFRQRRFFNWFSRGRATAEILQLPRGGSDTGVWTRLTHSMTQQLRTTFLVKFNHRIVAIGELFSDMLVICQNSVFLTYIEFILGRNHRCKELTSASTSGLLVRITPLPYDQYQHIFLLLVSFYFLGCPT